MNANGGVICNSTAVRLFENPYAARTAAYAADGREQILNLAAHAEAKREITSWQGYERTPLRRLTGLAAAVGVAEIAYKDESTRFGLGSFKALGGAYAVFKLLRRRIEQRKTITVTSADLTSGCFADITKNVTVTCATDGNHGRSVAWGARLFGCRCIIYVHATVSEGRCRAIAQYGAEVRRVAGNYDDAVRRAATDAAVHGWAVVSDTSYAGYTDVPRDVMQGYGVMVDETLAQSADPTHVFVQGGVGGLAATVCSFFWERLGTARPRFIVVEPDKADCLYRSAVAGEPMAVKGELDTIMAGLACGEVSILAWRILQVGADAFMTVGDDAAIDCMRLLAESRCGDQPIVAGESAVAGLAGFLLANADANLCDCLALDRNSRILLFGTEGATDPDVYARLVGRAPDAVAPSTGRSI